jgi:hypothetical protein
MPTVGEFHRKYWARKNAPPPPPPLGPTSGGFPLWQASNHVVMGAGLGALIGRVGDLCTYVVQAARWWWAFVCRVSRLNAEQRAVVLKTMTLLESPQYPLAHEVVRETTRLLRLNAEQRAIVFKTMTLLESPQYPLAHEAVRETARLLGFRDPKMWKGLSHAMKESPDHTENVYRHLEACRRTRVKYGEPWRRPDINLLVELAYHGFSEGPR